MPSRRCFILAASLVAVPASAQDRIAEVDRIFNFATPETPGCAVGVSQQGKVVANRAELPSKRRIVGTRVVRTDPVVTEADDEVEAAEAPAGE